MWVQNIFKIRTKRALLSVRLRGLWIFYYYYYCNSVSSVVVWIVMVTPYGKQLKRISKKDILSFNGNLILISMFSYFTRVVMFYPCLSIFSLFASFNHFFFQMCAVLRCQSNPNMGDNLWLDSNLTNHQSIDYYYYYVFILSAISPYTTGLKALFNQSDCTGTAPTHK